MVARPRHALDDLPPLTDATFDSDTYLRLVTRVQDAIAAFMTLWQAEASRAFSRASSTYLLAQEMVRLRHLLEPRRALATHPSWPEEIRKALTDALRLDLDELQRGLEEMGGPPPREDRSTESTPMRSWRCCASTRSLRFFRPPNRLRRR